MMGQDKIALGTDYPFPLGEWFPDGGWKPGELIESMNWPDAKKQMLLADNALGWLNMDKNLFL
jgi:aminocarboxymuconate-semialdehyde decarboxylase